MSTNYNGEGNVIDITLGVAAVSGVPIIVNNLLGVPVTDGEIGDTIAVSIGGVFNLLGVTGAVITQGEDVIYRAASDLIDDNADALVEGDLSGGCVAMETKTLAAGDRVLVKINQGVNLIEPAP